MANVDFLAAADQSADAGFVKKVMMAICATGMSIAANGSSTPKARALAQNAVDNPEQTAVRWARSVRVSGANISVVGDLSDVQITSGVEGVFAALSGA